jgi:hypothetical protein
LRGAHDRASCVIPIRDGSGPQSDDTPLLGGRGHSERGQTMTEASGGGVSRAEVERTLVQRSLQDEEFRQRLLDDPKGTVEQELGTQLPEGVEVRVVQESQQSIYLVLPRASAVGEGGEISDQELGAVAAGASGDTAGTAVCPGVTCLYPDFC